MRIVDRDTFLSLPPGTVFSKYSPCSFQELCIKGSTRYSSNKPNDFDYISTLGDLPDEFSESCHRALTENVEIEYNVESRDGLYDDDQLFAVWSDDDVFHLMETLTSALREGYNWNAPIEEETI